MTNMIEKTITSENDHFDHFSLCPICHKTDGHANAGRSHIFYCIEHKTSWCAGDNLFSDWRRQTEEEQRRLWHEIGLEEFERVEPYFYPRNPMKLERGKA